MAVVNVESGEDRMLCYRLATEPTSRSLAAHSQHGRPGRLVRHWAREG